MPSSSIPYCGPAPLAADLWSAWTIDWRLWLGLALVGACLFKAEKKPYYIGAWLGLLLAFVSPLCALTVALFSARALHHLLILGLIAPLFALAMPRLGAYLSAPLALGLTLLTLIAWHVPQIYSAAWSNHLIYWALQMALLASSVFYWAALFDLCARREVVLPLVLIAALTLAMGMIGAILTFAPRALYQEHATFTLYYGLSPLQDQHFAGLLMWVPGFVPFAIVAGLISKRLLFPLGPERIS